MASVRDLHDEAIVLAHKAIIAKHEGDTIQARQFAQQACLLEEKAGDMLHPEPKNEPTRSILYKSGASLALQAGDYDKVHQLIAKGLIGHPPAQVIEEYNSLLAQIPQ